jgi:hypothetical protein
VDEYETRHGGMNRHPFVFVDTPVATVTYKKTSVYVGWPEATVRGPTFRVGFASYPAQHHYYGTKQSPATGLCVKSKAYRVLFPEYLKRIARIIKLSQASFSYSTPT